MAPKMVNNQRNNKAEGSSQRSVTGLNYSSTHYVSQGTYARVSQLQLPKRQSDPYADMFGGSTDDDNKDIQGIRDYVNNAHDKLYHTLGGDKTVSAAMLRRRHTQLEQPATKSRDIRIKRDEVWFRGNVTKSAVPVALNAAPFINDVGVFQFRYGTDLKPIPRLPETDPDPSLELTTSLFQNILTPSRNAPFLLGLLSNVTRGWSIKKLHDWLQPEYFTGLKGSHKDMALLAEKFRQESAEAADARAGDATATVLVREYGEDGFLFLGKLMNEVDFSAYNYMLALQHRPARFMQTDDQLVESGGTSESLQLMYARIEEARFINTFGQGRHPVVEEWQPSAAFPGVDTLLVAKAPPQPSSRARHDERAQVNFDSIEHWDYSPSWNEVLNGIERNVSEQTKSALNAELRAAKKGDADSLLQLAKLCEAGGLGIPKGTAEASRSAKQLYTPAANKGNVEAQYRLGRLHADKRFTGLDGLRNDNTAVEWLTKAAEQGHPEAQADLGLMYVANRTRLDDHEAAILAYEWCESAVEAGVRRPDLFFALGHLYQNGRVPMEDSKTEKERPAIMEKWYLAAAKEGHVGAMRELGLAHLKGTSGLIGSSDGSSKGANDTDAARYLRKAAEQNDSEALYYLGEMCLDKRTHIKKLTPEKAAAYCFKRAADSGFVLAQFKLGLMLVHGKIDTEDDEPGYQEAARCFAKAAKQGHIGAKLELARLYEEKKAQPEDGKSQDAAAVELYKQAADKSSLVAQLALVGLYETGRADIEPGPEANKMIAKYLGLAASHEKAKPHTACELAELYARHKPGLPSGREGDKLAAKWYTEAANKGFPKAQYELARMYLNNQVDGLTNQESVALMEEWYKKAANAGHVGAQYELGLMYGQRKNYADAVRYVQMAADQGVPEAFYCLGGMYLNKLASIEGLTSKEAAVDHIRRAADLGFVLAQLKLGQMLVSGEADIKDGKPDCQEAARHFAKAVEQGNVQAMCELAKLFMEGKAHPEDGELPGATAEDLYVQAANKGSTDAQLELAKLYDAELADIEPGPENNGKIDEYNKKIVKYLEPAAKNGSADAQYNLALRHLESLNALPAGAKADQKITEAVELLLSQAAAQKHPQACLELGYLHEAPRFGIPDKPDFAKAAELYRVAAKMGNASAQYQLGKLYLEGKAAPEGVDKQGARGEAKRLFKQAHEQDHEHGSFYYGLMLLGNKSEAYNPSALKGRTLMEEAAGKGDPDLQYVLAECFLSSKPEANKNFIQDGIKWLEKAAVQGHKGALGRLQKLCKDKLLSTEQIAQAREYFQKAADEGNTDSMIFLGWMSEAGLALPKPDYIQAFKYYTQAAKKDDSNGYVLFRLGALTEIGYNGYLDKGEEAYRKAVGYYQQAADKGNDQAMYALGGMHEQGRGGLKGEEAVRKAVEYYQQAADKSNAQAMYALGGMHEQGRGGLKGEEAVRKAVEYYQQAAYKGNADALHALEQAADKGNAKAMYALGRVYAQGHGGLKGEEADRKAVEFFQQAAAKGNAKAMYALGKVYAQDRGGLKGKEAVRKAVEYYQQAAYKGNAQAMHALEVVAKDNADAMYALGRMYAQGRGGLSQDTSPNGVAVRLLKAAVEKGLEKAKADLASLEAGKGLAS